MFRGALLALLSAASASPTWEGDGHFTLDSTGHMEGQITFDLSAPASLPSDVAAQDQTKAATPFLALAAQLAASTGDATEDLTTSTTQPPTTTTPELMAPALDYARFTSLTLYESAGIPQVTYNGATVDKYFYAGTKASRPETLAELETVRYWARHWLSDNDKQHIDEDMAAIKFFAWNYKNGVKFGEDWTNYGAEDQVWDLNGKKLSCIDPQAKKTIIYFHGFSSDPSAIGPVIKGFEEAGTVYDYNFISIDWRDAAAFQGGWDHWLDGYIRPQHATADVGMKVAEMLERFVALHGIDQRTLLPMGHSLGAHACGMMCRAYRARTGFEIIEMIALDPAAPGYACESLQGIANDDACASISGNTAGDKGLVNWSFRSSDATYVQAIHSDGGFGGSYVWSGHLGNNWANADIDWYINGGDEQPFCGGGLITSGCNHGIAVDILTYLIPANTAQSKTLTAKQCGQQYDTDDSVDCANERLTYTDERPWQFSYCTASGCSADRPTGMYYVKTDQKGAPYYTTW